MCDLPGAERQDGVRKGGFHVALSRRPGAPAGGSRQPNATMTSHTALGFCFQVSRTLSDAFPFTALEVRSYYVPHLTEKGSEGHVPEGNQVQLTSPPLDP